MVDLRFQTHGAGATTAVNLVVMAWDDRIAPDETGGNAAHHLDVFVHPGDRRAPGEVNLALVSKKDERTSSGWDNAARYSAEQFTAIRMAAGANAADLTDARGELVGRIYGVRGDLLINNGEVVVNTRTLIATELPVHPDAAGRTIRAQIVDSMTAAKEARMIAQMAAELRQNQVNSVITAYTKEEQVFSEEQDPGYMGTPVLS